MNDDRKCHNQFRFWYSTGLYSPCVWDGLLLLDTMGEALDSALLCAIAKHTPLLEVIVTKKEN